MAEASCSKKLAGKSVNVEFSANVDSESDKENTPDVIDKNADELKNVHQKTAVDKNAPEGFSINNWKKGIVKSCQSFHSLGHLDSKLKYQMTVTNFIF